MRIEIYIILDEIVECCKIFELESVLVLEDNELVLEVDLESFVFGDDEYEEYGDFSFWWEFYKEVLE